MQQTWPNLNCEGQFEIDTDFEAYTFYDDGVAIHYDYYSDQDYLHIENEFWGYLYDEDNNIDMLCIYDEAAIELNIYDISGRLVRKLDNGLKNLGIHSVVWDGKDNFGNTVSNGLYIYRLDSNIDVSISNKIIFMK